MHAVPMFIGGRDAEAVAATCPPDAVHYFPAHMYGDDEPVRSGRAIGEEWARTVQTPGSRLSIDGSILCDPDRHRAAIEFTTERKNSGRIIRAASGTSSTPAPGFERLELGGYPVHQARARRQH
jgi:hypothetical protein